MNIEELTGKLRCGVHYYRPPTPLPEEWAGDLENCRKLGFAFVQARIFWRWCERQEGQYYWDDLDKFMKTAREQGCKVVFQINLENAPEYIFRKYDGYRVDLRGNKIFPNCNAAFYVGGWIPCFDNPEVMKHALLFVEKLVGRYKDDPTLALYHAWNEPRCRPIGECACEHSIASYQEFLKEKFGTIDKLNAFLGRCWGDFDQIDAARDTGDFADMYLWRQWGASRVADRVGKVTALLKKLDPARAVISHVGLCAVLQDPLNDISDDLVMSKVTDLYGTSYPTRQMPEFVSYMLVDYLRYACHGRFSVYEIYPSSGSFMQDVPAGMLQQWVWVPVSAGAKLLALWQYRKERLGVETNDAGLVESDGRANANTAMMAETLQVLAALEQELPQCRIKKPQAALVFDQQSDLLGRLEATIPRDWDYPGSFGLRCAVAGGWPVKGDVEGVYHLLHRNHYGVDFTAPQRWTEENLNDYKVLFACGLLIMDEDRADKLYSYVEQGGCLVVDALFARRSSNTWLQTTRPGAGLAERFGFREQFCLEMNQTSWNFDCLDLQGIPATYLRMEYQAAEGTEVLGRWCDNQAPAVVCRRIGRGCVIAVGTAVGLMAGVEHDYFWYESMATMGVKHYPTALPQWGQLLDRLMNAQEIGRSGIFCRPGIYERTLQAPDGSSLHFAFRSFNADERPDDREWKELGYDGARLIAELSDVKIWRA